jgi:hypothetical protein
MAREEITVFSDDLTGKPGDDIESYRWHDPVTGKLVELDLGPDSKAKVDRAIETIQKFFANGQVIGVANSGSRKSARSATTNKELNQDIRTWAESEGLAVAPRGRISQEIIDQYHARSRKGGAKAAEEPRKRLTATARGTTNPAPKKGPRPPKLTGYTTAQMKGLLADIHAWAEKEGMGHIAERLEVRHLTGDLADAYSEGDKKKFKAAFEAASGLAFEFSG